MFGTESPLNDLGSFCLIVFSFRLSTVRQNDSGGKRVKTAACRDDNHESKTEAEPRSGKTEQNSQPTPEQPKQDYIHVRARRGQATDSHSLAERVLTQVTSYVLVLPTAVGNLYPHI